MSEDLHFGEGEVKDVLYQTVFPFHFLTGVLFLLEDRERRLGVEMRASYSVFVIGHYDCVSFFRQSSVTRRAFSPFLLPRDGCMPPSVRT